jgi:thiosulfate reductase cytochrome b subunit
MVSKTLLLKIDRASAWILLVLMILFIVSGYSLTSEYGMNKVMPWVAAVQIHINLSELLVIFFVIHSSVRIYFALIRWGIIGRKK